MLTQNEAALPATYSLPRRSLSKSSLATPPLVDVYTPTRHAPSSIVDDSSEESEHAESDVDDVVGLDTDLTDVDTCTDEDDEDDKQYEGTEDEAWPSPNEDEPPEHYLQQLETFDE
ncbi:hypothetical protein ABVK25_005576 [Lepraria finkii]|uniref:Uncharacterized protein n=1 Tax=Lepraria finkii TaxID=1340010 RepID=A0ABR4B848_9LECA